MLRYPSKHEALSQCWLNVASLLKCNVRASWAAIVCWILLTMQCLKYFLITPLDRVYMKNPMVQT